MCRKNDSKPSFRCTPSNRFSGSDWPKRRHSKSVVRREQARRPSFEAQAPAANPHPRVETRRRRSPRRRLSRLRDHLDDRDKFNVESTRLRLRSSDSFSRQSADPLAFLGPVQLASGAEFEERDFCRNLGLGSRRTRSATSWSVVCCLRRI